ncbi:hypothetical protein HKD37_14G040007 [Glycine soja]|nr:hypothetical protein GmHk_14G040974 [Glycine max]
MKDCKNTSGEDVSFTSRFSQPLINSSQALKLAPTSSSGLCRSSHNKISQNSLELGPFSLETLDMQSSESQSKTPLTKSDFRIK